jgi:TonB family protein
MKRLISFLLWCVLSTTPSFCDVGGSVEILSDTRGVAFGAYLQHVSLGIKQNWYAAIPPSGQTWHGSLAIEFSIMKDGKVAGMRLVQGSGDEPLDRAAWAGIVASNPFPSLPTEFKGALLSLRFHFDYNPPSGPAPHWGKGEVVGRTYENASVGIEFTPPPTLELGSPKLKGNPGTLPLFVTINAEGEYVPATARKVMAFYTDALAYYSASQRSTEDYYMRLIVRNQQNDGYEPIEAAPYSMLGGIAFARHDFKKGIVYESVLVKMCDTQALVFIFAGADEEIVSELSAETELKLDPATSGCLSGAAATPDKPPSSLSSTRASSDGQVYRVSPDVKPPRVISSPQPSYPQEARKGHAAGKIVISMIVGSDGQPRDAKINGGISPELDQAAVDVAEKWQFQPGTKEGKPVAVKIAVEFDFRP